MVTFKSAMPSHHPNQAATALGAAVRVAVLAAALACPHGAAARDVASAPGPDRPVAAASDARFAADPASDDVGRLTAWVTASGDNRGLPFIIVDKVNAEVFVFDPRGQLRGASRALLGLAHGDDSVPGIGDRPMSSIRPDERTTPAGRFVASLGHDTGNQDILWVDYADAISLHRVVTNNPKERRLQRLAMPSPRDRRISYGCINVPAQFYDQYVIPTFTGTKGIVYILPETRPIRDVFVGLSR